MQGGALGYHQEFSTVRWDRAVRYSQHGLTPLTIRAFQDQCKQTKPINKYSNNVTGGR